MGASPDPALLIAKYGGRAPRYTSYPTAVQFSNAVGQDQYRQWLKGLKRENGAVSLYVHVPFCDVMCWYCGCHTAVVNKRLPVMDYVGRLLKEIDLVADAIPERLDAASVHFGGGTPNMLTGAEMAEVLATLGRRFRFSPQSELAAELDPRLLSKEWIDEAVRGGLNRASLGVQDFDADVQAAINRVQPFDLVAESVAWLREAGVVSINMDLMYGLPRQTLASLERTIDQALSLDADRISLFGYAHVPWLKSHQKLIDESELPDPALRYAMQNRAADALEARGWRRLGLDHFAKPDDSLALAAADGSMRRNFQGYTTDAAPVLIGFGASSIGRMPQGYVQNHAAVPKWREALDRGELPVARGLAMTDDDRFRADIIERLMCDFSVDLASVADQHGRDTAELEPSFDALRAMEADGLVVLDKTKIEATRAGRDFIRTICTVFDVHLDREAVRHSQGV
ncbi:MAG: oxygen-independent coproporphyrinogen III oxidase [Hyphomicrobiales bacterium]|nr:oxygen-independent coproporphyrinogen III oxidase [Hyphomicrobiales bacterium]